MNTPSRLTSALLIAASLSLPYPVLAESEPVKPEEVQTEQAESTEAPAGSDGIELHYTLDGAAQVATAPVTAPWEAMLNIVRESITVATKTPGKAVTAEVKPSDMDENIAELMNNPSLQIATTVDATGKGESLFTIKPFAGQVDNEKEGKMNIDWKGLNGTMKYTGSLESASFDFNVPGLKVTAEKGPNMVEVGHISVLGLLDQYNEPVKLDAKFPLLSFVGEGEGDEPATMTMKDFVFGADMEEAKEGIKVGSANMGMGSLSFADPGDGVAFTLEGLGADSSIALAGEVMNYVTKLGLKKLTLPADADPIGLGDISYDMQLELNSIDAESIADIQKTVRQLKQQGMSEEMMGIALLGKLMEKVPSLINRSPVISIPNLNMKTAQGNVKGNANVMLDASKLKVEKGKPLPLDNPAVLIAALAADVDLKISKNLLKQFLMMQIASSMPEPDPQAQQQMPSPEEMADMQLQQFVAQKFIAENGDDYQIIAKMSGGKLLVNGQEMPLPLP